MNTAPAIEVDDALTISVNGEALGSISPTIALDLAEALVRLAVRRIFVEEGALQMFENAKGEETIYAN